MSNPPPDQLPFRLIGAGVMTGWLKTVICIGCGNGSIYAHSTDYFSPIKNKLVSVANWRPSYTWAVETVTAVHTSSPVSFVTHQKLISISHWLKLRPSQCSTHMLEFCFNCSVSFVTLDCYNHVTLSKQIDHFNLNQPPKCKKLSPRALIRICFKTVSNI